MSMLPSKQTKTPDAWNGLWPCQYSTHRLHSDEWSGSCEASCWSDTRKCQSRGAEGTWSAGSSPHCADGGWHETSGRWCRCTCPPSEGGCHGASPTTPGMISVARSASLSTFLWKIMLFYTRSSINTSTLHTHTIVWLFVYNHTKCIVQYCGRVPAANGPGCTAAEGLLYKPWSLVFPTCTARCLHQRS